MPLASARHGGPASRRWTAVRPGALLQARAGLAHQRDRFGEHDRHDRADLLGLLLGRALDVDAVDRGHGEVDRELDRVVGPRELLLALHLLGELRHAPLQFLWIAEQTAEAFHAGIVEHPDRLAADADG